MASAKHSRTQLEWPQLFRHLAELRRRLFVVLLSVALATAVWLPFADRLIERLVAPLGFTLLALNPTDTILQWLKVSLIGGIALAMPVVLYQIVAFLLPTLDKRQKRYLLLFLPLGGLFFVAGVLFGVLVLLPVALSFLTTFGESYAQINYHLNEYISFVTTLLLALGLAFETPLVIFFLAKLQIVSYQALLRNSRYAFLLAAIVAAVITPADPWSMIIVMIPLFLLYLLGVLFARFA